MAKIPVTVSLNDLRTGSISLSSLEEAFGPDSLGIIVVKDLPSKYVELRRRVLSYSSYLANLPAEQLAELEHPTAKYLTGWSLGKEKLKSDRPDTLKGSYYVNCAFYQNPSLQSSPISPPPQSVNLKCNCHTSTSSTPNTKAYDTFPEYTAPNIWPSEDALPDFQRICEELCSLIIDVATLVAGVCDVFAEQSLETYPKGLLERIVKGSMTTKARLLHYFPPPDANGSTNDGQAQNEAEERTDDDDWCATHLDHGCLTGLTSAMFVDETANPPTLSLTQGHTPPNLPELDTSPDSQAGLYIHSRSGTVTKVTIPRDCLAFQTGEALEVITKGKFRAVPHFVKGSKPRNDGTKVARNTLAVFTQPNLWEVVDRETGVDFARFARGIVEKNY